MEVTTLQHALSKPEGRLPKSRLVLLVPVLDFGGVESRILIQAEEMQSRVGEVRICTFWKAGAAAERLRGQGIPVDVLGVDPSIRNPRATVRLRAYLRKHKPDILHACIGEANWHGLIAGALAGVPVRIVEEVGMPFRSALTQRAFPWLYRLAHCVVGVSQATCDFLAGPDGADPAKVRLVYNAADAAFFESPPVDERAPESPFRVLAVGRLDPVKNQTMLIRAFAGLRKQVSTAELYIAGEGPSRSELEMLIRSLNVGDHVRLLGFRSDVRELLAQADLFVLPSHSEGHPIALVEAMACELPVLASDVGGVGEVIHELGEEYLLSPTDEAGWTAAMTLMAVKTPGERKALGRQARQLVIERFSPETYVANLVALYEDLLSV